jgi:drug/metabolite transporter (DMT)-like permease
MSGRAGTWIAWLLLLSFETVCQISLKKAGLDVGAFDFSRGAFVSAFAEPWLWAAIGCYLGAFLAWITILRKSTLSAAFASTAIVFVAVMAASWLVFGEHIGVQQIAGSSIILLGILMFGADGKAPSPEPAPSAAHPGSH